MIYAQDHLKTINLPANNWEKAKQLCFFHKDLAFEKQKKKHIRIQEANFIQCEMFLFAKSALYKRT